MSDTEQQEQYYLEQQQQEQLQDQEQQEQQSQKLQGTVKWFNVYKGFGFILPHPDDEIQDEVFIHLKSIQSSGYPFLKENDKVCYEIEVGQDGRRKAINVTDPEGLPLQGQPVPPMRVPPYYYPQPVMLGRGPRGGRGGRYYPYMRPGVGTPNPFFQNPRMYYEGYMQPPFNPQLYPQPPQQFPLVASQFPPQPQQPSQVQVVIHNLPYSYNWRHLKELFKDLNPVRAEVFTTHLGQSRGYGIVRFSKPEDANQAINTFNLAEVDGRKITVRLDRYAFQ